MASKPLATIGKDRESPEMSAEELAAKVAAQKERALAQVAEDDLPPIEQAESAICVCGQPMARMRADGPNASASCIKFMTGGAHKSCQRNIPSKDIFWGVRKPKSTQEA